MSEGDWYGLGPLNHLSTEKTIGDFLAEHPMLDKEFERICHQMPKGRDKINRRAWGLRLFLLVHSFSQIMRARVMAVIGGAHVAVCDVRVDLRRRDVAVA